MKPPNYILLIIGGGVFFLNSLCCDSQETKNSSPRQLELNSADARANVGLPTQPVKPSQQIQSESTPSTDSYPLKKTQSDITIQSTSESKNNHFAGTDSVTPSSETKLLPLNDLIVKVVQAMPKEGAYATSASALSHLISAIRVENGRLQVNPEQAKPSFCSAATYLVFVSVLDRLNRAERLPLSNEVMQKLLVRGQADGDGIWGRWNANGPGTARLFYELHLGKNFTSFDEACAGDFLKIFWNENIGAHEFGHSVIYLGSFLSNEGLEFIKFWSANQPFGYGVKTVLRSKIKRALFSRLEFPNRIVNGVFLGRDDYLSSMMKRPSTPEEMLHRVSDNE